MISKREQILKDEAVEKKAIRDFFGSRNDGFFVEVGANEANAPESQTYHLELAGWNGILIEPIPELASQASQTRPNSKIYQVACTSPEKQGDVEFLIPIEEDQLVTGHASLWANLDEHNYKNFKKIPVKAITLSSILLAEKVTDFEFLSIDVEGAELEVLQGIDFSIHRPKLILLEDKHLYLAKHRYLKKMGYKIVQRLNRNCWYIPVAHKGPEVSITARFKLFKRMFVSIWIRKIQYAIRHRTLSPFWTL